MTTSRARSCNVAPPARFAGGLFYLRPCSGCHRAAEAVREHDDAPILAGADDLIQRFSRALSKGGRARPPRCSCRSVAYSRPVTAAASPSASVIG